MKNTILSLIAVFTLALTAPAADQFNQIPLQKTKIVGTPIPTQQLTSNLVSAYTQAAGTIGTHELAMDEAFVALEQGSLECIIGTRSPSVKEKFQLMQGWQTPPSCKVICHTTGGEPVYILISKASAMRWNGFQRWVLSDRGQQIVQASGFVPTPLKSRS